MTYIKDGAAIYKESFAIIRREADLSAFPPNLSRVVVRMIHACGQTDLPALVQASPDAARAGIDALAAGAPILCDAHMVANGVTRTRLPAQNEVLCTLRDPRTPDLAAQLQTTCSAAALELWRDHLAGSVVVIGNAPTALFHLLEMLAHGAPHPALIIGIPVGFVGAAESKQALADSTLNIPFLTVHGRRGGSAIAAAAVNALASEQE
ncbi:precorrin-8X methylmutase [Granulicella tundricola]|uniref:Precorrin-8X methylmutase n=1 Tax=Granulicella tundricola (strain ATCC BAA-1859 / DSM 23138 / MP5ACTX9) TaxID=1198114 RepID=E8X6S2_GRATM|nr:precorrin-8X methylmutase [Granulicella tundricola]ADW71222.1 Precorrin-8X methylmutase [Granulicella tundricola MP5ACTX9]